MPNESEEKQVISYRTPRPSKPRIIVPWLGFVCAVLCLLLTQFIWMVSPFGTSHVDTIAMFCSLSFGLISALAGCISGLRRFERATGSDSQQAAGCVFGVLNLLLSLVLALALLGFVTS